MKFELARRRGREEIGQILKICQSFSPEWQLWQNWQLWQRWQSGRQALEHQKLQNTRFFQPLLFHKVSESEEQLGTGNLKTRILFNLFTRAAQTSIFLILKMKKMNKCRNFLRHE